MNLTETDAGIELITGDEPTLALIWLHGLGADGGDFVPIVGELDLPCVTRFVFPHAPERPVTINGGMRMRAWYDIVALGASGTEDETGIDQSADALGRLIDREVERGFASERIVVAGFSQGGAIALHRGLREQRRLGGILALSTYLPVARRLAAERAPGSVALPIWMGHGTYDPVIPLAFAEGSRDRLTAAGYDVEWHAYPMDHSVCIDEIRDIGTWLARFG